MTDIALAAALDLMRRELAGLRREVKRLANGRGQVLTMNTTETAAFLGVSRHTINNLCRTGAIRYIPRGKKGKRIPRAEIERWARESLVSSPDQLKAALDGRKAVNKTAWGRA